MRFNIHGDLLKGGESLSTVLKTYHNRLKRLWRDSVKAFILATVDAMAIDTGMSVASLQPLGARVRLRTLILETLRGKGPKFKRGYTDLAGNYHPDQSKSRAHGERLGQKAYTLEFGTPSDTNLLFTFDIVVFQHQFHEPTWESLQKGEKAFIDYFEANFQSYINAQDLVVRLLGV